jgi:hypothetical protein
LCELFSFDAAGGGHKIVSFVMFDIISIEFEACVHVADVLGSVMHHSSLACLEATRPVGSRLVLRVAPIIGVFCFNVPSTYSYTSVPPFPTDLLDAGDSPNIFIISPASSSRYPQPLSMNLGGQSAHSLHSMSSPGSSPTQGEFPHHTKPLSRQQSFQHVAYRSDHGSSTPVTPLPPSPASGSMELYDGDTGPENMGRSSVKRQRTSSGQSGPGGGQSETSSSSTSGSTAVSKRLSRARSDSAPLGGYGLGVGLNGWQSGTRPRSGSSMAPPRNGVGVPNIGTMTRTSGGPPLLSISTTTTNSPR